MPLGCFIVLGALLAPYLFVADLESALVREANEVVAAPRFRPSHVDHPIPVRQSDSLRQVLPGYEKAFQALASDEGSRTLLSAVAKGERPVSDLPPALRAGLIALERQLDRVLAASHAAHADLGPDHDPFGPLVGTTWLGVQAAAKHAAVRIWMAPTPGERSRLLSSCLDGMALGRDAAVSGGLIGRMTRAAVVALLQPACGAAVDAAPAPEAWDAAERLRLIRDAVPSFGAMLREEGLQVQLLTYGHALSDTDRAMLLDRPRAFANDGSMAPDSFSGRLRSRAAWRDLRAFQGEVAAVGFLPVSERDAAFAALAGTHRVLRYLLASPGDPDPVQSYARYSRLDVSAGLRLDLLVAAIAAREFQRRHDRWPASAEALASSGLLRRDEAERLTGLILADEEGGSAFRVSLPVPRPDAPPAEATVLVSR